MVLAVGLGKTLVASLSFLLTMYANRWKAQDAEIAYPDNPSDFNLPKGETFDFIIVGAGTAGCILANRLSKQYSVLVLEAGGEPPPLVGVPQLQAIVSMLPDINFLHKSTPQKKAAKERGGVIPITAGKMLGGSGSHNHMVWERGSPHDYDRWAKVTQDDTWQYKNIEKYFFEIENYTGIYETNGKHGKGFLGVTENSFAPGAKVWLEAGQELNFSFVDPNGPQTVGFSYTQSNRLNGRRSSTYTTYLKPIMQTRQKTLKVYKYSFATRIIFDGRTAVGVEFERHGVPSVAYASKEVIVAAGAFLSPIILFKSGIGPADQVKAAKAERHIASLPVGRNYLDHPRVDVGPFVLNDPSMSWSIDRNLTPADVQNFIKNGQGPLASSMVQAEAHVIATKDEKMKKPMKSSVGDLKWPNFWIAYNPLHNQVPNAVAGIVILGLTSSVGTLKINETATSMEDDNLPILDVNFYDQEKDLDDVLEGVEFFVSVMEKTKAFAKVGARLVPYAPCSSHVFKSRDYWKCFIYHKTTTGFHGSGTCRMGHSKDPKAVVDSKLKVIGVKGLRVVDGSVMPYVTNANTNAPTTLIAEKGAAEILKEYAADSSDESLVTRPFE